MNTKEMEKLLEEGRDPIELSLMKWKEGEDLGMCNNCALCCAYNSYSTNKECNCESCPLFVNGFGCLTEGSSYLLYIGGGARNNNPVAEEWGKMEMIEQLEWLWQEKQEGRIG